MFDIYTAEDYFFHIENSVKRYHESKNKSIERLFFILNGLNHLREWIAPEYKKIDGKFPKPKNKNEYFFKLIWDDKKYKIINSLCNATKHFDGRQKKNIKALYGLSVDEWDSVDDVQNFDVGPPSAFTIEGIDISVYIDDVLNFYKREWFSKKL